MIRSYGKFFHKDLKGELGVGEGEAVDKISLGCFFLFAFFVHSPPLSLLVFSLCSAGRVVGSVLGYWRSSYVAKKVLCVLETDFENY